MNTLDLVKKKQLLEWLDAGRVVSVALDSRQLGCELPEAHMRLHQVTLRVAWAMEPPIELEVSDSGIFATLSFGGVRHRVVVPWAAVYAAGPDGEAPRAWVASIPTEILDQVRDPSMEALDPAPDPPAARPPSPTRPKLRLVD